MIDGQDLRPSGVNAAELTKALQKLLKETESAIRQRLEDEPSLQAQLRERHEGAVRAERTEGSTKGFLAFSDEAITQSAVHWLLGCVFVRFLEDNGWLDEPNAKAAWISGPGDRLEIAKGRRSAFLRADADRTDRDYLLYVFAEVSKLPGVAGLFDPKHNPLFALQPATSKGLGAAKIIEFFQQVDPDSNALIHDFSDLAHDTRFLGDLYQNLSESARKRYALCQTPDFVIDFILDRTLTPALDAFGLETARIIDPSCGSGHFLLAAFARLFRAWQVNEPGTNTPALVQRALDAVYGVDLNPFAVEISRFRLLIASLEASRIERLKNAPNFRFNIVAADSLLHGVRVGGGAIERSLFEDRLQHFYETEDEFEVKRILGQQYHVVVGNPPYINVSDPILRDAYRRRFLTCHGKYQLGVPFTERFFDLAIRGEQAAAERAGWMGMLVSNAFMTREFGSVLVEKYLVHRDLTHVIDMSGLNLPAHGTPTTILLGRNQRPIPERPIRAVRGLVGVLTQNENLAESAVWQEIINHVDESDFLGKRISVTDAPRSQFASHPWAMGGGGAAELKEALELRCPTTLGNIAHEIGIVGMTNADEIMALPSACMRRHGIEADYVRPLVRGDDVREWAVNLLDAVIFPYSDGLMDLPADSRLARWLWPARSILGSRATFNGKTYFEEGRPWWEWHQLAEYRLKSARRIVVAEIATHNHCVFQESSAPSVVSNQTAPLVLLPSDATHDDYISLMATLNSSSVCFYLRQVSHDKGGGGVGGGLSSEPWERRKCFTGTVLSGIPVPRDRPTRLGLLLHDLSRVRCDHLPANQIEHENLGRSALDLAKEVSSDALHRMIALQEELDWWCYRSFGMTSENLTFENHDVPLVGLGERAFEILLARSGAETVWFDRHRSRPTTELPNHWPVAYRELVERRISAIEENPEIALVERPEYKRRWNLPTWEEMERSELRAWLLDRSETNAIWKDHKLVSCAQLRDSLARDPEWFSVAENYHGGPVEALDRFVVDLVTPEAVPHLPVLRYTESGLRKRAEWEKVWDLQRREDIGEDVATAMPSAAALKEMRYGPKDMMKANYWRLRGGLDVPKERFILYSFFQRDSDASPVLGWAGWSHLEQAKALATYYQKMRMEEGWEPERLKPILAGLLELKPWLLQWHNEIDPEIGERLGEYFARYAESQCQELGFSPEEVRAWQPPVTTTARRGRKRTS